MRLFRRDEENITSLDSNITCFAEKTGASRYYEIDFVFTARLLTVRSAHWKPVHSAVFQIAVAH